MARCHNIGKEHFERYEFHQRESVLCAMRANALRSSASHEQNANKREDMRAEERACETSAHTHTREVRNALALAVMGGAIMSHLTVLGIVVMNDHGLLFGLAITVALCSAILLLIHRRSIPVIGKLLP
jgi:hypothetical protein